MVGPQQVGVAIAVEVPELDGHRCRAAPMFGRQTEAPAAIVADDLDVPAARVPPRRRGVEIAVQVDVGQVDVRGETDDRASVVYLEASLTIVLVHGQLERLPAQDEHVAVPVPGHIGSTNGHRPLPAGHLDSFLETTGTIGSHVSPAPGGAVNGQSVEPAVPVEVDEVGIRPASEPIGQRVTLRAGQAPRSVVREHDERAEARVRPHDGHRAGVEDVEVAIVIGVRDLHGRKEVPRQGQVVDRVMDRRAERPSAVRQHRQETARSPDHQIREAVPVQVTGRDVVGPTGDREHRGREIAPTPVIAQERELVAERAIPARDHEVEVPVAVEVVRNEASGAFQGRVRLRSRKGASAIVTEDGDRRPLPDGPAIGHDDVRIPIGIDVDDLESVHGGSRLVMQRPGEPPACLVEQDAQHRDVPIDDDDVEVSILIEVDDLQVLGKERFGVHTGVVALPGVERARQSSSRGRRDELRLQARAQRQTKQHRRGHRLFLAGLWVTGSRRYRRALSCWTRLCRTSVSTSSNTRMPSPRWILESQPEIHAALESARPLSLLDHAQTTRKRHPGPRGQ